MLLFAVGAVGVVLRQGEGVGRGALLSGEREGERGKEVRDETNEDGQESRAALLLETID